MNWTNTNKTNAAFRVLLLACMGLAAACGGGGSGASNENNGGGGGGGGGNQQATQVDALTTSRVLASLDTANGSMDLDSSPWPGGFGEMSSLAVDALDRAYAIDGRRDVLVRVNPEGQSSVVGDVPDGTSGLVADRAAKQLFTVRRESDGFTTLLRLDLATAEHEEIGPCVQVASLAYDPGARWLFGLDNLEGKLHSIDPDSGDSTELFQDDTLRSLSGLTYDSVTGILYAVDNANPAGLWTLGIQDGALELVASFDAAIRDIAIEAMSGTVLGLTDGLELVELGGAWPDGSLSTRAVLGHRIAAMTYDPADDSFFAVDSIKNKLIKVEAQTGRCRLIGDLHGSLISTLVYDPLMAQLYGVDLMTNELASIDPATAEITPMPGLLFGYGTVLAIDPETGTIYGYEEHRDLAFILDVVPSVPTVTIIGTALLVGPLDQYFVADMEYDPALGRLVAAGFQKVEDGPGSFSFYNSVFSFDPRVPASESKHLFGTPVDWAGISRDSDTGRYYGATRDQPLFELDLTFDQGALSTYRTVTGPWQTSYRSAASAGEAGRVYAIDATYVYEIDRDSGSTRLLGRQPDGVRATDVVYDDETGFIGLYEERTVTWVAPSAPWLSKGTASLGDRDLRAVTRDPRNGFFFGVAAGVLYRVKPGALSALALADLPVPNVFPTAGTLLPEENAVYVTTSNRRQFRIDILSGEWTEAANTRFRVAALIAR